MNAYVVDISGIKGSQENRLLVQNVKVLIGLNLKKRGREMEEQETMNTFNGLKRQLSNDLQHVRTIMPNSFEVVILNTMEKMILNLDERLKNIQSVPKEERKRNG